MENQAILTPLTTLFTSDNQDRAFARILVELLQAPSTFFLFYFQTHCL